jgi:hypothetical protein
MLRANAIKSEALKRFSPVADVVIVPTSRSITGPTATSMRLIERGKEGLQAARIRRAVERARLSRPSSARPRPQAREALR